MGTGEHDTLVLNEGPRPELLDDPSAAQWLADKLHAPEEHRVGSVVPQGFAAYARLLHPAGSPRRDDGGVRWREVSAWSGVALQPNSAWHDIALPERAPAKEPPWTSPGPVEGALALHDVKALLPHLARATSTPDACFFALWEGSVAGESALFTQRGTPSVRIPGPQPPRGVVTLPWRTYWLYCGPLDSVTRLVSGHRRDLLPNLWWPEDHAWCVASEIDLAWSYLAGARDLVRGVMAEGSVEALEVGPDDDYLSEPARWLGELVERATDELLNKGELTLELSLGTVEATWRRRRGRRGGEVRTRTLRRSGEESTLRPLKTRDVGELRRSVELILTRAIVTLCNG